jgi:MFS family permease
MVASQVLHGVCYACFFAASYIYVDRIAETDVRHSAQTVYGVMILGGGPVLGGFLSGWLGAVYTPEGGTLQAVALALGPVRAVYTPEGGTLNYSSFWYAVAAIGLVASLVFVTLFRDETRSRPATVAATGGGNS